MATSTIDKKIKNSVKSLDKSVKAHKKASGQLDKIAKEIKRANRENRMLNTKLEKLSEQYIANDQEYKRSKEALTLFNNTLEQINQKLQNKHSLFIQTLANQSSIIYAMSQSHEATRESIVMREAYKLLKQQNSKDLANLKRQIDINRNKKKKLISKRKSAKRKIDRLSKQRKEYENKRQAKQKLLQKLTSNEDKYQTKIQRALDEQHALRSTLAHLNIIQKKEAEEEKRIIAAQKAAVKAEKRRKRAARKKRRLARKKARREGKKVVYRRKRKSKTSIKNIGSSYKRSKVYAYHGGRTISPISGARVVKAFGSYIDPIYKIKIFNESITLRAPSSNAKVKNVLNGKVVFAGSSSMLGKVVVISHSGRMHTVYAGLSKIAPTIRKGRRIKRGYVIGKVSSKLIFEATKNSKHINPMSLIRL